jgi:hypothetical protein
VGRAAARRIWSHRARESKPNATVQRQRTAAN